MPKWFWQRHEEKLDRQLVGDLDALRRKVYYITFKGKDWKCPDLTIKEYAQFCSILQDIEDNSSLKTLDGVNKTVKAYDDLFKLCLPELPWKLRRNLTMEDATLLFLLVLKRSNVAGEKKKTGPLSQDPAPQSLPS